MTEKDQKNHTQDSSILAQISLINGFLSNKTEEQESFSINSIIKPKQTHKAHLQKIEKKEKVIKFPMHKIEKEEKENLERKFYRKSKKFQRDNSNFQQNFTVCGVCLSVALVKLRQLRQNVLLVPFQQSVKDNDLLGLINSKIKYQVLENLSAQFSEKQIGSLISIEIQGLWNFRKVYFMKISSKISFQELYILKGFENLLRKMKEDKDKSIVIPAFQWLESEFFSEYLLSCIYKYLQEESESKIEKIVIALEKGDEFLNYAVKLRRLSDLYLKNGIGFVN